MKTAANTIGRLIDGGIDSEDICDLLERGWKISLTSCGCGGRHSWMMPHGIGAYEMFGCICHRTDDALYRLSKDS